MRPILFDLDGTLVESGPSITASIRHALREVSGPELDQATLNSFIGPPLRVSFNQFAGFEGEELERVISIYMAHQVETGISLVEAYPGIPALLDELRTANVPLAVATSKRTENARMVLQNTGLLEHFEVVSGAEPERLEKRHSIETALAGLRDAEIDTTGVVMIGDRVHDVEGAAHFDMPCIAVTWGYGVPSEWQNATSIVETVAELRDNLL